MSNTPETDALANEIYSRGIRVSEIRMLEHARQMERERDQARKLAGYYRDDDDNKRKREAAMAAAIRAGYCDHLRGSETHSS